MRQAIVPHATRPARHVLNKTLILNVIHLAFFVAFFLDVLLPSSAVPTGEAVTREAIALREGSNLARE